MEEKRIEKFFFEYIKSVLCETQIEKENDAQKTIKPLYALSKVHDLAHLVAEGLDRNGLLKDDEGSEFFSRQRIAAVYRYEQIQYELEEICRVLEEAQIEHIPLKGSVIRKYYPEPWMRTSCDIDILVKKENLQTAIEALKANGFQYEATNSHDVSMWTPSGVHLELHFDLIESDVAEKSAQQLLQAWERAQPCEGCSYRLKFDDAFFYFYHIAHMAKHFLQGGCGIRPFIDIWILKKHSSFCGEEVETLLRKADLWKFAKNAEKLANIWFGSDEHNETTKQMEDYILQGGVYGTLEQQLAMSQNKKGGKFKHLLSRVFLSYRAMLIYYPSLRKCPILYPFYQVRRWFRIAFCGGRKRAFNEMKLNRNLSQLQKEKAKRLIDDLGL